MMGEKQTPARMLPPLPALAQPLVGPGDPDVTDTHPCCPGAHCLVGLQPDSLRSAIAQPCGVRTVLLPTGTGPQMGPAPGDP